MKWASVNRTLLSPLNFLRHIDRSSDDSGRASVQDCGGDKNLSQFRQNETDAGANYVGLCIFKEKVMTHLASECPP
jgi:hypothetical protein